VDFPQVSLIIGARSWELFIPTEIFKNDDALCLFHTPIGYVFFGASNEPRKVQATSAVSHFIDAHPLENDLQELWQSEGSENVYDNAKHPSFEDRLALKSMRESITKEDGYYVVRQPWKSLPPKLPNNEWQVRHRFEMLDRRFRRDEEFFKEYKNAIEQYVE